MLLICQICQLRACVKITNSGLSRVSSPFLIAMLLPIYLTAIPEGFIKREVFIVSTPALTLFCN